MKTIYKRYKNWRKLMKYLKLSRKDGNSKFTILTTSNILLVYPEDKVGTVKKTLRIRTMENI